MTGPTVPVLQLADILTTNLRGVFANLCYHRYGGPISLERVPHPDSSSSSVLFRIDHNDLPPLWAHFTINHVGGTVYDVQATVKNGPSQSFTYSLPDPNSILVPRAPHLAQEVASFLLDALERQVGSDLLRHKTQLLPLQTERSSSASPP